MKIKKFDSILFVDDEESIHKPMTILLKQYTENVITAYNGEDALLIVKENKPQLIISDINMPFMDGIKFCEEVKKLDSKQFFVFFTAHEDKDFLHQAVKLKVDAFLIKPLNLVNFKEVINEISEKIYLKKQLELKKEIEQKNEFFQNIFDGISDSICIVDKELRPLLLNKTAKEYLEYKTCDESLRRFYLNDTCNSCEEENCPFINVIESKKSETSVITSKDKNGKELIERVTITPIKDEKEDICGYMEHRKDITELITTQTEIYHEKYYDSLTNTFNLNSFEKKLNRVISEIEDSQQLAIITLDISDLKNINDSFGLPSGDKIIKHTVLQVSSVLNDSHTFARLTGDSFAIMFEDFRTTKEVVNLIERIIDDLDRTPLNMHFNKFNVNLNIGVSIYPQDGISSESLIKNANTALHYSKEIGSKFEFFNNSLIRSGLDSLVLESYLKDSVNDKSFELYFQPQHTTINNSLIGAEVLIRWFSSPLGVISPDKFIPVLERLNLIQDITKWMLRKIFLKVAKWKEEKLSIGIISINISVKELEQEDKFVVVLQELIKETKCNPKYINLEVTESMLIKDREKIIQTLNSIVDLGFKISIDDFGTGYSSLAMLKSMPIHKLKIDKSFIDDIPNNKDDEILTKTVIDLAKNLNLEVIAEGVETKEQLEFLHKNACYEIQGYYYSKPLKEEDFLLYLKR